jgi:hypothetical protein
MRNGSLYENVMWCGRKMEKISRTDRVRNEEVLKTVKEDRIFYKQ